MQLWQRLGILPFALLLSVFLLAGDAEAVSSAQAANSETHQDERGSDKDHGHGDETEHGDADHAGAQGDHHGGGLPQLAVHTFASQIFWLIVSFALLYWLLSKKALPRLEEVMQARQSRLSDDLEKATEYRQKAESANQRYDQMVAQSHAEGQAKALALREELMKEFAGEQAKLDQKISDQMAQAQARINESKQRALVSIGDEAVEVARLAAEKLSGVPVSIDDARRAFNAISH